MSQHRDAQTTVIFGKNGTGKSTFCERIVKYLKGRCIVITYGGMPKIWRQYKRIDPSKKEDWNWKSGIRQIYWVQHEEKTADYIYKYFRGGTIVFDDCREYIPARLDTIKPLKRIVSSYRHMELDLFFVAHARGDVPKQVWRYNSTTWVGTTDDLINKSDIGLGSADKIVKAQAVVNQAFRDAKKKGDGSHYGIFLRVVP